MDPRTKVAAASLASTITLMYLALQELGPLISAASLRQDVQAAALFVLASGSLYQGLNNAASWVILKIPPLKRFLFGANYLEDTWVGFYEDASGQDCLLVEQFEQDFDGITIKGQSFDQNGRRRAQWVSESVAFDEREGTLRYFYTCHVLDDKKIQQGVTDFTIRRNGPMGAAQKLDGYSSDLHDGHRSPSWETRLRGRSVELEKALKAARSYRDGVVTARSSAATPPVVTSP